MIYLRMFFLTIATILLIWFILPVFTGRILNAGNGTGIVLCLACLLFTCRPALLWSLPGIGKGVLLLLSSVLVCDTLYCLFRMVQSQNRKPSGTETVLVLGCGVDGEEPSRILVSRIQRAASYLQEHPSLNCVVTGGKGDEKNLSEAEAMIRGLTSLGISPKRIIREDQAVSTYENFRFSKAFLQGKAAVVTSEFHMFRSLMIAEYYGIDGYAVPAQTPWWLLLTFFFREVICIPYEIVRLRKRKRNRR